MYEHFIWRSDKRFMNLKKNSIKYLFYANILIDQMILMDPLYNFIDPLNTFFYIHLFTTENMFY